MTLTDIIIISLTIAGGLYGLIRGIRPALFTLVAMLLSLFSILVLTAPLEALFIRFSRVGSDAYTGAPAVAVFIMEGETGMAYLASLIPFFLTLLILALFTVAARLGKRYLSEPSKGILSRIFGLIAGLFSGGLLALLFAVQLVRLPRPLAGEMFWDSILINALNKGVEFLLPTLAGGI